MSNFLWQAIFSLSDDVCSYMMFTSYSSSLLLCVCMLAYTQIYSYTYTHTHTHTHTHKHTHTHTNTHIHTQTRTYTHKHAHTQYIIYRQCLQLAIDSRLYTCMFCSRRNNYACNEKTFNQLAMCTVSTQLQLASLCYQLQVWLRVP